MYFIAERLGRIIKEIDLYKYPEHENVRLLRRTEGERKEICRFEAEVLIPERFDGMKTLLRIKAWEYCPTETGKLQFLAYVNGSAVQGVDANHTDICLTGSAKAGDIYTIELHPHRRVPESGVEAEACILAVDETAKELYYDLKVPYECACLLDNEDMRRIETLNLINEAVNLLDLRRPGSEGYRRSLAKAGEFMRKEFYEKLCGKENISAVCTGHTHIDVAWLWTLSETRGKAARSFSTVLDLMNRYPEYIFMSSQPQLYKFIKEDHPDIFMAIKKRAAEGRWEPEGAMWLEADCNVPSGESLVRQLLFGTRFFEKEFGVRCRILWLPDAFGYTAALPQLLKKSGIDYFATSKISWSEYNRMPWDSFQWRGIDGTEILAHFITTQESGVKSEINDTTYNGILSPGHVRGAWERYRQKDLHREVLISFGYGDGGGGPTEEMLENARRLQKGIPGCPGVRMGKMIDFFTELEKKTAGNRKMPVWVGELYLELHRGTYTSMAYNKRYNRKSELLYLDAELLSVISHTAAGAVYPAEALNRGWETILLNQFHDILPGTSIKEVYEESHKQYQTILEEGNKLVDAAVNRLSSQLSLEETSVVVFNQLSGCRSDIVEFELPDGCAPASVCDSSGKSLPVQEISRGDNGKTDKRREVFFAESVPAKGYKAFVLRKEQGDRLKSLQQPPEMHFESKNKLENRFFILQFDHDFNIASIYDKRNGREILKEHGKANVLQAFEDKPHNYDAWDINIYYSEKMWEINEVEQVEILETGPVRAALKICRKFLDSRVEQVIQIYNDIPRIDFVNTVDWKERHILLKVAFPVDIHSDKATYEIQYGNWERPTHWNTSWDYARFEVCAHKWADLSEAGYGVSLMNDCKYGYDIKDGVMRLSLLKSAVYPNTEGDRRIHHFTYSLYPHEGDWRAGGTVPMAYSLNCPMYAVTEGAHHGILPAEFALLKLEPDNVIAEVVKKAEDSGDIIIRVYEFSNRRTDAALTFCRELEAVWECTLMEQEDRRMDFDKDRFRFLIKPYEIKTFKLRIK